MQTRCPACATVFRVTVEQLKARHARVRCGHCRAVFNALDTLIDGAKAPSINQPPAVAPPTSHRPDRVESIESTDEALPPAPQSTEAAAQHIPGSPETLPPPDGLAVNGEAVPAPMPLEETIADEQGTAATQASYGPVPEQPFGHEAKAVEAGQKLFSDVPSQPPHRRVWPWALALVCLLTVLLMQAVVQFRSDLVLLWPEGKPMLQALCALRGCELTLPHKAKYLSIEASDLHPAAGQRGSLVLLATLKNRAPFAQEYPYLELSLTDMAELPIMRRVIAPKDYLPPGINLAAGFPANGERSITLTLDVGDSGAAGYRLYLFYP